MSIETAVIEFKRKHSATWQDKPEWYWALRLLEEVVELMGTLMGLHRGPVDWELTQIATICMNWCEYRAKH